MLRTHAGRDDSDFNCIRELLETPRVSGRGRRAGTDLYMWGEVGVPRPLTNTALRSTCTSPEAPIFAPVRLLPPQYPSSESVEDMFTMKVVGLQNGRRNHREVERN
jgi:hypothetical protein